MIIFVHVILILDAFHMPPARLTSFIFLHSFFIHTFFLFLLNFFLLLLLLIYISLHCFTSLLPLFIHIFFLFFLRSLHFFSCSFFPSLFICILIMFCFSFSSFYSSIPYISSLLPFLLPPSSPFLTSLLLSFLS